VTPIVSREEALAEREQELDLLRQVLTRLLTHNVRNALTTIHGNAEFLADELNDPHRERAATIKRTSEDLRGISEKARHVEQILDDAEPISHDLATVVQETADDVADDHADVSIDVTAPESCEVTASHGLEAAVEALLDNAAAYNDPRTHASR
jgi:signal transduction histidine kinase